MRRSPISHAASLTRRTSGLSEAHKALIHLLAGIAVEQYLAESEPNGMTETTPADDRQAVAR